MAVVVVGVMAGTSPAMAKKAHTASAWSNQHKDNKVFGEAIHNLRLASDKTNWDASGFQILVINAATALQKGLVDLAAATANFEYGVAQLGKCSNLACDTFTAYSGSFVATPPVYATGEMSTVTADFAPPATTDIVGVTVAFRSVDPAGNDAKSTPACRVTAMQPNKNTFSTSTPNADLGGAPAYPVVRGPIAPPTAAEKAAMPLSMVSTDTPTKLMTASNAAGQNAGAGVAGGFSAAAGLAGAGSGGPLQLTLACVVIPKS